MFVMFESVNITDDATYGVSFQNFHGIFSTEEKMIEYLIEIGKEKDEDFYWVDVNQDEVIGGYCGGEELSFPAYRRNWFNARCWNGKE